MVGTPSGERNGKHTGSRITATYDYVDEEGKLLFQVARYEPGFNGEAKTFRQRRRHTDGAWVWGLSAGHYRKSSGGDWRPLKQGEEPRASDAKLPECRRVLYNLPALLLAPPDRPVCVVEGEKDVDTLKTIGLIATTNPMGAGKWRPEYAEALRDRHVVILPDNDEAGRRHAGAVEACLRGVAAAVSVVELPGLPAKGDVSDWLRGRGNGPEPLLRLCLEQTSDGKAQAGSDGEADAGVPSGDPPSEIFPWPEQLADEALHGLAGEVVRAIAPASEAHPAALLLQLLVGFGNLAGRSAHFVAEADRHYPNEFVVLVGQTAKARKGTSWGHVRRLLSELDGGWARDRVLSGLSSGEGLLWHVRDRPAKQQRGRGRGGPDRGVADKRLLVYEPEFANVLKQMERQGNVLSALLRTAWESGDLQSLTKNSPTRATGAHVSLVGHITADELRRYLSSTEIANGFGNRHLLVCVRRSQVLPEGGSLGRAALDGLRPRLEAALAFARGMGEVRRDPEARAVWCREYAELSEGRPGLAGALLARAEAHVMRLALVYALLDRSELIGLPHLLAGLAVWRYVEQSVYRVFGDSLGDPVADELIRALRASPGGLTRNEMNDHFGRHQPSHRLGRALALLAEHGLARCTTSPTGGRPEQRWFAAGRYPVKR